MLILVIFCVSHFHFSLQITWRVFWCCFFARSHLFGMHIVVDSEEMIFLSLDGNVCGMREFLEFSFFGIHLFTSCKGYYNIRFFFVLCVEFTEKFYFCLCDVHDNKCFLRAKVRVDIGGKILKSVIYYVNSDSNWDLLLSFTLENTCLMVRILGLRLVEVKWVGNLLFRKQFQEILEIFLFLFR